MPVRYITVTPITNLFVPATKSYGAIAIVGAINAAAQGPKKTAVAITNPLSVSTPSMSLTTSAATPAGNATLHFAAVPATTVAGMARVDLPASGAVPAGTTVQSTTATTVVMSQNAAGPGAGSGDAIQFTNANNGKPVD